MESLVKKIKLCNKAYHENQKALCTDYEYDLLIEKLTALDPTHKLLSHIGHLPSEGKVKLPYHMGSIDQFKTDKQIDRWAKTYSGPYNVSVKLDGISALLVFDKSGNKKFYSRGNGTVGQDITNILPFISHPTGLKDTVLRGELIVSKKDFAEIQGYATPRSYVNAMIAMKGGPKKKTKISYIVFEVLNKGTMTEQFKWCKKNKVNCVPNSNYTNISVDILTQTLNAYKKISKYDMDGIVIMSDKLYDRNKSGNPKYGFKFKINPEGTLTTVKKVHWRVSKHGKIVPQVEFNEILLNNSKVSFATGIHAKHIVDNKIGVGAKIMVVLSGDVIPAIVSVLEGSREKSLLPDTMDYAWDETHVNIYVKEGTNQKRLEHFFNVMGTDYLGPGIIKKLESHGFNCVERIYKLKKTDLLKIEGFQDKSADKLLESIRETFSKERPLSVYAYASMTFGENMGSRKLLKLEEMYGRYDKMTLKESDVVKVDGLGGKNAKQIVELQAQFKLFMKYHPFLKVLDSKKLKKVDPKAKKFVLSGFRSNEKLDAKLKKEGGVVVDQVSKDTFAVIVKDLSKESGKVKKARSLNIPVYQLQNYVK